MHEVLKPCPGVSQVIGTCIPSLRRRRRADLLMSFHFPQGRVRAGIGWNVDAFDGQVARLDPSKVPAAGAPEAQMVSDGSQKGLQFCGSSTCSEGLHTRRCWKGPGNF